MLGKDMFKKKGALEKGTSVTKVRILTLGDVKVGDLVFYESIDDVQDPTALRYGGGKVHHVEICTQDATVGGKSLPQPPSITGQINREANKERGFTELRQTRTTPLKLQPKDRLLVVRCKTEELRQAAARYAKTWCKSVIPFHRRGTTPNPELWDLVEMRDAFRKTGRFRAIRYAARRGGELVEVEDTPRPTKGMFCSHFVITCFQVAALERFVSPAPKGTAVQDKKGACDWKKVPEKYKTVRPIYEHYQRTDESVEVKRTSVSGIMFWRFDVAGDLDTFDWARHITAGMMLDGKKVMPHPLLASLQSDDAQWEVVGALMPAGDK